MISQVMGKVRIASPPGMDQSTWDVFCKTPDNTRAESKKLSIDEPAEAHTGRGWHHYG